MTISSWSSVDLWSLKWWSLQKQVNMARDWLNEGCQHEFFFLSSGLQHDLRLPPRRWQCSTIPTGFWGGASLLGQSYEMNWDSGSQCRNPTPYTVVIYSSRINSYVLPFFICSVSFLMQVRVINFTISWKKGNHVHDLTNFTIFGPAQHLDSASLVVKSIFSWTVYLP